MSKSFVEYHGCDLYNYKDGTRKQVSKNCSKATYYPFWKLPKDVTNSVAQGHNSNIKKEQLNKTYCNIKCETIWFQFKLLRFQMNLQETT